MVTQCRVATRVSGGLSRYSQGYLNLTASFASLPLSRIWPHRPQPSELMYVTVSGGNLRSRFAFDGPLQTCFDAAGSVARDAGGAARVHYDRMKRQLSTKRLIIAAKRAWSVRGHRKRTILASLRPSLIVDIASPCLW